MVHEYEHATTDIPQYMGGIWPGRRLIPARRGPSRSPAGIRIEGSLKQNWLHMVIFPLATASVVYLTLDIEYPRIGLIRLDNADQILAEVRALMK